MFRNRLMGESSWLALRAPDDGAGAGGDAGDGGDNGGAAADAGATADAGAGAGGDGAAGDGAAAAAAAAGSDGGGASAAAAGSDGGAAASAAAAAADAGAKPDWRDKELDRRARKQREEREARERAETENKNLRELLERMAAGGDAGDGGDAGAGNGAGRTYTQQDVQREAERIAAEKLRKQQDDNAAADFNRRSNDIYLKGRETHGDAFDQSLRRLGQVGMTADHMGMILETDNPMQVLHELGTKPEEFQRIMDLPPLKQHAEFVKLSLKPTQPAKKPSGASPPTEPLGGRGGEVDNRYSEDVSPADWHAQEAKREREYWERKNAALRG